MLVAEASKNRNPKYNHRTNLQSVSFYTEVATSRCLGLKWYRPRFFLNLLKDEHDRGLQFYEGRERSGVLWSDEADESCNCVDCLQNTMKLFNSNLKNLQRPDRVTIHTSHFLGRLGF